MELNTAIHILSLHQKWRKGGDEMQNPEKITRAIDKILNFFECKKSVNEDVLNLIESEIFINFGYNFQQLRHHSRKEEIIKARQISMYLIKTNTTLSLAQIGSIFDKKHDTVLYTVRAVKDVMSIDKVFNNIISKIQTRLNDKIQNI